MLFPKFYNKRFKHILVLISLAICTLIVLNGYLSHDTNQVKIENDAIIQFKASANRYNPKQMTYVVFQYLTAFNKKKHTNHPLTSNIGGDFGIWFHWDDWVDLSAGNTKLNQVRKQHPSGGCPNNIQRYGAFSGFPFESMRSKITRSKVDLYCNQEVPKRIVIATDKSFVELPVVGEKRFGTNHLPQGVTKELLLEEMKSVESKQSKKNTKNLSQEDKDSKEFQDSDDYHMMFGYKNYKKFEKEIDIEYSDFIFNIKDEIVRLKEKWNRRYIWVLEKKYLDMLEWANHLIDFSGSNEFFKNPWKFKDSLTSKIHAYAYPFYQRSLTDGERQSIAQHMIQTWFQFAQANGLKSWLGDSTLLGWSYNGIDLPWSLNIDIHMPIRQLDRLGRDFNKTLLIENPRFGNGKYYLEVSPTYVKQAIKSDSIEARLVDIHSGYSIEIKSLMFHSDIQPPKNFWKHLVNSDEKYEAVATHTKDWEWQNLRDTIPIRHTYFEGTSVYIPHNVTRYLSNIYKDKFINATYIGDYNYQRDLRLWVPNDVCNGSPKNFRFINKDDYSQLSLKGACNKESLKDEYQITEKLTTRHRELNSNIDKANDYDPNQLKDLPIMRKDVWEYFNDIVHRTVDHTNWYNGVSSN